MRARETQDTALTADLNAVNTGLTDPLYKANMANMLAMTQCLAIAGCILRTAVGTALLVDLPSLFPVLRPLPDHPSHPQTSQRPGQSVPAH
jgi:hypothetical protein